MSVTCPACGEVFDVPTTRTPVPATTTKFAQFRPVPKPEPKRKTVRRGAK